MPNIIYMDLYFGQLIEYVLGALPEDQRFQVKAHLDSGCKDCNEEVRMLQETFHLLPGALPAAMLSPTLKSKLNDAIKAKNGP